MLALIDDLDAAGEPLGDIDDSDARLILLDENIKVSVCGNALVLDLLISRKLCTPSACV